jgi:hypothetical protein
MTYENAPLRQENDSISTSAGVITFPGRGGLGPKFVAAEQLARRHKLRIFPIMPNAKTSAIKGWQERATTNIAQLEAWWRQDPDYNVGVYTEGMCFIDIDVKHDGEKHFAEFLEAHKKLGEELPPTFTVRTQSGGRHLYFATPGGVEVRGSVGKIAPGIDIRGAGGYVVGPGSTINGKQYTILPEAAEREVMFAPEWFVAVAKRSRERSANAGKRLTEETEQAIAAAEDYIANHAPCAIEGEGGDLTTYKVAARLFDFGLNRDTALELMLEYNESKCEPPWDIDELEKKVDSAEKNRQLPIGIDNPGAPPPGFEPVELPPEERINPNEAPQEAEDKPVPPRIQLLRFRDVWPLALTHGGNPLVDDIIDEGAFSVTYGASGSGKSCVTMDMDFHIAAGRPWNGHDVLQGPVAYVAAEGGTGAYKRLLALRNHYGVDDVPLYLIPSQLDLLRPDPAGQTRRLIQALREQQEVMGRPFVKITIDTVAKVMPGGNENGPEDMGMIVHHFGKIREATKAHLAGIHHTGHSEARRARGHSSLKAAVDTEIEVFLRDKDTKAFDFTVTKQRDGDGNTKKMFTLKTLELGFSPRGKKVTSSVVIPRVTRVKDLSDETKLLAAIGARMEAEKLEPEEEIRTDFILRAAFGAGIRLGDQEHAPEHQAIKDSGFRQRIDELIDVMVADVRIKWLRKGWYRLVSDEA